MAQWTFSPAGCYFGGAVGVSVAAHAGLHEVGGVAGRADVVV